MSSKIIAKSVLFNSYLGDASPGVLISRRKQFQKVPEQTARQKGDKVVSLSRQLFSLKAHINNTHHSVSDRRNCLFIAKNLAKSHKIHKKFIGIRTLQAFLNLLKGYGCHSSYGLLKKIEKTGAKLPKDADSQKIADNMHLRWNMRPTSQASATLPNQTGKLAEKLNKPSGQEPEKPVDQALLQSSNQEQAKPSILEPKTTEKQEKSNPQDSKEPRNQTQSKPNTQEPKAEKVQEQIKPQESEKPNPQGLNVADAQIRPPNAEQEAVGTQESKKEDLHDQNEPGDQEAQRQSATPAFQADVKPDQKPNDFKGQQGSPLPKKPINKPSYVDSLKKKVSFPDLPAENQDPVSDSNQEKSEHLASTGEIKTFLKNIEDEGLQFKPDQVPDKSEAIDLSKTTEESSAIKEDTAAGVNPTKKKARGRRKKKEKVKKKGLRVRKPDEYLTLKKGPPPSNPETNKKNKKNNDAELLQSFINTKKDTPNKAAYKKLFQPLQDGKVSDGWSKLFKDFVSDEENDESIYKEWGEKGSLYLDRNDLPESSVSLIFNSMSAKQLNYLIIGLFIKPSPYNFINTVKGIYSISERTKQSNVLKSLLLFLEGKKDSQFETTLEACVSKNRLMKNSTSDWMQFFFKELIKSGLEGQVLLNTSRLSILERQDADAMQRALASLRGALGEAAVDQLKKWGNSICANPAIAEQIKSF